MKSKSGNFMAFTTRFVCKQNKTKQLDKKPERMEMSTFQVSFWQETSEIRLE